MVDVSGMQQIRLALISVVVILNKHLYMILILNAQQLILIVQLELQMQLLFLVACLEEHAVLIKLRINVKLMQVEVFVFGTQI